MFRGGVQIQTGSDAGLVERKQEDEDLQAELPLNLVAVAEFDRGSGLSEGTAKLIVLELYREDRISPGRVATLCHTPVEVFLDYAGKHAVPLHYGLDELHEDWQTKERLGL